MKQPPLIIPDRVDVPAAVEQTLANGVKLYMLACDEFEVVRMTFVFHAGVSMQKKPFTASARPIFWARARSRSTRSR